MYLTVESRLDNAEKGERLIGSICSDSIYLVRLFKRRNKKGRVYRENGSKLVIASSYLLVVKDGEGWQRRDYLRSF